MLASNVRPARTGASLVELLVALVLFGVIGLATLKALDRQARFHAGVLSILEARSQHAAAHEVVATELRGVSPSAGDITRLSDSAIVFRLPIGGAVACVIAPGIIDLAPDTIAAGQVLARFRTTPQAGDTVWMFDEAARDVAQDDGWIGLRITAAARAAGRCAGSPLLHPVLDGARPSWSLSVGGTIPATVTAGAPIRLTRTARFALYRGGTGEHWLGYTEILPATGAWITIQPVSGPYLPFGVPTPAASGVAFAVRDSSGAPAGSVTPAQIASISVSTRTHTTRAVRMDGLGRGRYADSLHSLVGLRNVR